MTGFAKRAFAATCLVAACCSGVTMRDLVSPRPVAPGACVVIGFLGGRDRWDDAEKGVRRIALALGGEESGRIAAETFENRRRDVAERFVVEALDLDGDGALGPKEARGRRLVVYGQSFGGAAVVKLARSLGRRDVAVEVLLTLQVDSVGLADGLVPENVRYALNLYQSDGLVIEGEHPVRALDASRTTVLGNWRFRYDRPPGSTISLDAVPWWKLFLRVAHAKMDRDERVWDRVQAMIGGACRGDDLVSLAARLAPARDGQPVSSSPNTESQ